jgi:hypothetical protein
LLVYEPSQLAEIDSSVIPGVSVLPFPIDDALAPAESRRLIDAFHPKALISIEKNGPNKKGIYHMVGGTDNSGSVAKLGRLFEAAAEANILTIGIGDRGNEIGFRVINDVVTDLLPYGKVCRCPCRSGVADDTYVDVLVTACVSNWGAYGIAACLAELLRRPEVLHTSDTEEFMLRQCALAGGIDGFRGRPGFSADGMRGEAHRSVVEILHEIIAAPAARTRNKFSTPLFPESSNVVSST